MPFIRTKLVKGISYYYLVESFRNDGKPRQRVLAYLGEHSTVRAAYKHWADQAKTAPDAAGRKRARAVVKELEPYL